jgi:very-short-patch-repair endonuclease
MRRQPNGKSLGGCVVFSDWRPFTTIPAFVHNPRAKKAPKGDLVIAPQFPYGPYRLDILIRATNGRGETKLINVEVDGKAHHNTTKIKWDKDRERDENMAAWNVEVKRFWGSVIAKDPFGCAEEVVAILTDWLRNSENAYLNSNCVRPG